MNNVDIITIWLFFSLLAGAAVYSWIDDIKEAAFMFLLWPYYVLLAVVVGSLVLMAWACWRINYWIRRK